MKGNVTLEKASLIVFIRMFDAKDRIPDQCIVIVNSRHPLPTAAKEMNHVAMIVREIAPVVAVEGILTSLA
jgi:hypothetical protein